MKPNSVFEIIADFSQADDGISAYFSERVVEYGFSHSQARIVQIDRQRHPEVKSLIYKDSDYSSSLLGVDQRYGHSHSIIKVRNNGKVIALVYQTLWPNCNYRCIVISDSEALSQDLLEEYVAKIPQAEDVTEEGKINVNFWYLGGQGPTRIQRSLEAPDWPDIRTNYNAKTIKGLDSLMDEKFRPLGAGQFILWSGEPGSGKTTALRSLSQVWHNWCDVHYITDPEQFFGNAGYLMSFLGQASNIGGQYLSYYDTEEPPDEEEKQEDRWMLLVFEDTGELLSHTAKAETGQGLSRFLNVVDGFIGQGLKIIVLITTNEDFKSMHPAVVRPGRCRANIEFQDLTAKEVQSWANKHGIPVEQGKAYNLADLYALLNEQIKTEEETNQFGFAWAS